MLQLDLSKMPIHKNRFLILETEEANHDRKPSKNVNNASHITQDKFAIYSNVVQLHYILIVWHLTWLGELDILVFSWLQHTGFHRSGHCLIMSRLMGDGWT